MTMLSKYDETGAHKFHYSQQATNEKSGFFSRIAFWRSDPFNYSGTFMTNIRSDGKDTRVYLLFGTGESCDTAGSEHVLGIFMDRLS